MHLHAYYHSTFFETLPREEAQTDLNAVIKILSSHGVVMSGTATAASGEGSKKKAAVNRYPLHIKGAKK